MKPAMRTVCTNPSPLLYRVPYPLVWVKHVGKNRTDSPTPFIAGQPSCPHHGGRLRRGHPSRTPSRPLPLSPKALTQSNPRLLKGDRQDEGTRR